MPIIKGMLAFMLSICMVVNSFCLPVYAADNSTISICVVDTLNNNLSDFYDVIKTKNNIMFKAQDLAKICGFEYKIEKDTITYTRGNKNVYVYIKKNTYTALTDLSEKVFQDKIVRSNGDYYISGAEIIPWLNVNCSVKDGTIYITRDEVSYWDINEDFTKVYKELNFNFAGICEELGVNSTWLKAESYIRDNGLAGTFLDFIPISGESTFGIASDYVSIFEDYMLDGYGLNEAIGLISEMGESSHPIYELSTGADFFEILPDEVQASLLFGEVAQYVDEVEEFMLIMGIGYKKNQDKIDCLATISGNRYTYGFPEAMWNAASMVSDMYDDNPTVDDFLLKASYTFEADILGAIGDAATGKGIANILLSALDIGCIISPKWINKVEDIPKLTIIASHVHDAYNDGLYHSYSHMSNIEEQRHYANMYLYAIRQCWLAMADYARNEKHNNKKAKEYEALAQKACDWEGKFLIASKAAKNDSHEYKDEYENELRTIFSGIQPETQKPTTLPTKKTDVELLQMLKSGYIYMYSEDSITRTEFYADGTFKEFFIPIDESVTTYLYPEGTKYTYRIENGALYKHYSIPEDSGYLDPYRDNELERFYNYDPYTNTFGLLDSDSNSMPMYSFYLIYDVKKIESFSKEAITYLKNIDNQYEAKKQANELDDNAIMDYLCSYYWYERQFMLDRQYCVMKFERNGTYTVSFLSPWEEYHIGTEKKKYTLENGKLTLDNNNSYSYDIDTKAFDYSEFNTIFTVFPVDKTFEMTDEATLQYLIECEKHFSN